VACPHCAVTATAEQVRRTALGDRTFRCPACRRLCNERTGAPDNRLPYPTDLVVLVVLWRRRYKRSLRDLAEMFLERGVVFSHDTVRDREARFAPLLTARLRAERRGQGGMGWRGRGLQQGRWALVLPLPRDRPRGASRRRAAQRAARHGRGPALLRPGRGYRWRSAGAGSGGAGRPSWPRWSPPDRRPASFHAVLDTRRSRPSSHF